MILRLLSNILLLQYRFQFDEFVKLIQYGENSINWSDLVEHNAPKGDQRIEK